jgi:CysZ protein
MIHAFVRALGQLFDGRILGLIGACTLLSLACFVGAWFAIDWLLVWLLASYPSLQTWIGGVTTWVATLVAAWFLFPLVTSAFVGLFLENVARIVEARHYPDLGKAPGLPLWTGIGSSLRFLVLVLGANVLLLLLWFAPPVYAIGYLLVNGFLLGREYFELVALRRLGPPAARSLRIAHQGELLLAGIAFTFLLTLPVVNLVIPILATAVMVHRFEDWRRRLPPVPQALGG